ncbi:MAG: MFS transporter [Alphaproteobacteria bacterium]|nr:MFS transporter [Alphaproteobacteria bacterium]
MTSSDNADPVGQSTKPPSAWAPFGEAPFAVLWIATVISSIGTWMHDVGAGWLMTTLDPSPMLVASIQAATTLPIFLFVMVAGAVADLVDRRKLLIWVNVAMAAVATVLALMVHWEAMTPLRLLFFTFLMGSCAAFLAPAWQAIVPSLTPRSMLPSAIALNSMGINISRAIGPAIAGFLIVGVSLAAPFAVNALTFIGIIAALIWWKPKARPQSKLPPEHLAPAIAAGVRYVAYNKPFQATVVRAFAFFLFASAYWAMLPLIAKDVLASGPETYGVLLTSVGAGAVGGALLLPQIKKWLGANKAVAVASALTAAVLFVLATTTTVAVAAGAAAVGGLAWIAVLSSLNYSVQVSLPDWGRARGLSMFLMLFSGAMAGGSLLWGQVASSFDIQTALVVAGIGALAGIAVSWPAKLNQGEALDLSSASHWPDPVVAGPVEGDRGPVMIQIHYRVAEQDQPAFLSEIEKLADARRRNGGYGWTVLRDADDPESLVETWLEASWISHLRHHERVSQTEKAVQDRVNAFHQGEEGPVVTHRVSAA